MPIIKSAKKRVRTANKATIRNAKSRRVIRDSIKVFNATLGSGTTKQISEAHAKAVSAIDVAAKKNVIHKNKAARKKVQLSKALKLTNLKPKTLIKQSSSKAGLTVKAKPTSPKVPIKKRTVKIEKTKKL